MALSKQSILKHAGVFKVRQVHVPELADGDDDVVLVRGMTVREFEINQSRANDGLATASIIARCVQDSNGGRVFEDDDVAQLAELPLAAVQEISKAIMEESGLTDSPDKAVEEAGKASEPTPDDGSYSV